MRGADRISLQVMMQHGCTDWMAGRQSLIHILGTNAGNKKKEAQASTTASLYKYYSHCICIISILHNMQTPELRLLCIAEIKVQDLNEPVHSKVHDDSLARKDHLNIFLGKICFRVKCTIFTANCG